MALSESDKAECREIAREIVKEVLIEHIKSCPHGQFLMRSRMLLIGLCIGSGIGGGGAVYALIRSLAKI